MACLKLAKMTVQLKQAHVLVQQKKITKVMHSLSYLKAFVANLLAVALNLHNIRSKPGEHAYQLTWIVPPIEGE
jgi:hypothetical protein